MTLPLSLIETLQREPAEAAWSALFEHAWEVCAQPIAPGKTATAIAARERRLADVDHYLATADWALWADYEATVLRTAAVLADWWQAHAPGRAVLILDALSLRELPWILQQAEARGLAIVQARPTGAELPPNTTPFAHALGFAQRSALDNNGGNHSAAPGHVFPGARTESADLPWTDAATLIGSEPDWVFWHHWPDHRLHDHDAPGKGLQTLAEEVAAHLSSDAFWAFLEHLATGRRLVITADHGYAASGQFPDSGQPEADFLKTRYKSGRAIAATEAPQRAAQMEEPGRLSNAHPRRADAAGGGGALD